ncbi:MAG: hypothetical protein V4819_15910 [Verrucomicrobiota bacterium]
MNDGIFSPLASVEAIRPVFMIVMGIFLMVIAWRLSQCTHGWTARLIISGALLLGFGYAVMLPLYEAGSIERISPQGHYHGSAATAIAWHSVKLVTMNSGWLLFGLGLAMHAKVFTPTTPRRQPIASPITSHESVA